MTLYSFNSLGENEKAEHIWQNCHHLGSVTESEIVYSLYANRIEQNYFIEFVLKESKIITINAFIKGEALNKYIDRISLVSLQQ